LSGGAFTIAARTEIDPEHKPVAPRAVEELASSGERYLDDILTSYVHVPALGFAVGYAF
jgi:hypothetical protein